MLTRVLAASLIVLTVGCGSSEPKASPVPRRYVTYKNCSLWHLGGVDEHGYTTKDIYKIRLSYSEGASVYTDVCDPNTFQAEFFSDPNPPSEQQKESPVPNQAPQVVSSQCVYPPGASYGNLTLIYSDGHTRISGAC